jgi:hypothetical protein
MGVARLTTDQNLETMGEAVHGIKFQSPFNSVSFSFWAEEFARIDRLQQNNPRMRWDEVCLNHPGSETYSASVPHVMNWNSTTKNEMWSFCG